VYGRPPRKGGGSCWSGKEAEYVLKLREEALAKRTKEGLEDCFVGEVKMELTIFAPNITKRKDSSDYMGDLDSLVGGVFEAIQPGPDTEMHPELIINPILKDRKDVGPEIALLVEDDAQVTHVDAKKVEGSPTRYSVVIETAD